MDSKKIKVGLIGLGTVGGGVVSLIKSNFLHIKEKTGVEIELKKVFDQDISKAKNLNLSSEIIADSANSIINDPEIQVVVEAIGGENPALDIALDSIKNGKHFVTSNKELIAKHFKSISSLAKEKNLWVLFEASVGGGIPIVSQLRKNLSANKISEVFGIVNGTTNYILTKMDESHIDFLDALKMAQNNGYAESDPKNDIEGFDASYKAAILASIAFDADVDWNKIQFEGIKKISLVDIKYAKELGFSLKLLAVAKKIGDFLNVKVHPSLIPLSHPLSSVKDAFNAIYVKGDCIGQAMFYGQGAGALPTASAIVSDIIEIASSSDPFYPKLNKVKLLSDEQIEERYYIRLIANDKPGVLAKIAGAFGEKKVSIKSALQKDTIDNNATIVIITHKANSKDFFDAVNKISGLPEIKEVGSIIRVGME